MATRKGLFHIVEIVIISIVMFVMITQLSLIPEPESDWSKTRILVQGRDILYSMGESGVEWSDEAALRDNMNYSFGDSAIKYKLEYRGVPPERIIVGCLCDGTPGCTGFCNWFFSEMDSYNSAGPLSFNNFPVTFTVINSDVISNLWDVGITNQELTGFEYPLLNFISSNKGFILVQDIDSSDFNNYEEILRDYFAINRSSGTGAGSVSFNLLGAPNSPGYFRIPGYFETIPNATGGNFDVSHTFSSFSGDTATLIPGPYGQEILKTTNGRPACIAKTSAAGNRGRTAWISDSPRDDDWKTFLTSLVIWSADNTREVIQNDLGSEEATVSLFTIPSDTSRSDYMFMPFEAVLTLGYIFG